MYTDFGFRVLEYQMSEISTFTKATDVRPRAGQIIKTNTLVGFRELVPLSLIDRRALNLLIEAAWDSIEEDKEHRISADELRFGDRTNRELEDTIKHLQGAYIEIKLERNDTGERIIKSVPILSEVSRSEIMSSDGSVWFKFSQPLIEVVRDSQLYTRMTRDLMLSLQSKYSLALYEIVQSLRKLKYKQSVTYTLDEWREKLGVEPGKLTTLGNFRQRCWQPAIDELNFLGDLRLEHGSVKEGRTVVGIELIWVEKTPEEKLAALKELQGSKIGRKQRRTGDVERVLEE